ncbi:hypothetical protein F511_43743 [Dorcoceras hygrometricum]|uniref:Uncharacterized protein n=1 Tax=Dorcoceras hygrometricum TaxID=472368 RepID=A0A2Z7D7Y9_9LAMI|nr:hypothetical protein F511_43743 [Dorcoceras hygrometricum]
MIARLDSVYPLRKLAFPISLEGGEIVKIVGGINCFKMSSIKNPLAAILDSNKFTGLNNQIVKIVGGINCFKMSSIKNPLAAILDSNKFTGLNNQDWLRNLNIVLASEKLLYTLVKSPPKEAPADVSPEELTTLNKWWDDELKTR